MQRTRSFGAAPNFTLDPFAFPDFSLGAAGGDPAADPTTWADLAQIGDARVAALQNVDPITALQSRISAAVPSNYRLPLALGAAGILALVLLPSGSGGGRRR